MHLQPVPLALPNYSAIGSIVTRNMTRRSARTALYNAGWRYIGGGSFASVWASPDGTRVAKVTKPDRGQRALIKAAQAHPDNPHLPTIYGYLGLKRGGFVVEMERLDWGGNYDEVSDYDGHAPTKGDVSDAFYEAWHAVDDQLYRFGQRGHYLNWDLHDENVMFRDGVPVLVDPLYEPNAHINASGHRGSDHCGTDGLNKRLAKVA